MLAPTCKVNRATAQDVERHARRAIQAALKFFGQDNDDFPITLLLESPPGNAAASFQANLEYLRGSIRLDMDYHQEHPEMIWANMGHEVAHIVLREAQDLRDEVTKPDTLEWRLFTRALEAATVRLERVFLRECPDPGWESA